MKRIIKEDVYDISKRINQIDKNYFVVYCDRKRIFELHDKRLKPTFSITLFNKLDKRSIDKVFKSQSKNYLDIFKAIDNTNENIEKYSTQLLIDKAKSNIKELFNQEKYF